MGVILVVTNKPPDDRGLTQKQSVYCSHQSQMQHPCLAHSLGLGLCPLQLSRNPSLTEALPYSIGRLLGHPEHQLRYMVDKMKKVLMLLYHFGLKVTTSVVLTCYWSELREWKVSFLAGQLCDLGKFSNQLFFFFFTFAISKISWILQMLYHNFIVEFFLINT